MRIAIAGGGTFAFLIAQELCKDDEHAVIVLSRQNRPAFEETLDSCQLLVVDYEDEGLLRYSLQGVDLVISTVCGNAQLNLIDAARRSRVRLFVPSEFEGSPTHRPDDDPLDEYRGSAAALSLLKQWSQVRSHPMQYTVFTCGIFYDRFHPEGLHGYNMGYTTGISEAGSYLVNMINATADVVETNGNGRPVHICMTAMTDVAKFVAAAVENVSLPNWPREYRMRGDRLTIRELVRICERIRGVTFSKAVRNYNDLEGHLDYFGQEGDAVSYANTQRLLATADGRYDYTTTNLNDAVGEEVEPIRFRRWLERTWNAYVAAATASAGASAGASGSGSGSGRGRGRGS